MLVWVRQREYRLSSNLFGSKLLIQCSMGSFTWKDSFGGLDWVGGGPRTTQPYRKNCYYSVSSVSLWPTAASSGLPCQLLALRNFSLICLSLLLFRGTCPRVPFSSLGTQAVRSYCIVNCICDLIVNRSPMLAPLTSCYSSCDTQAFLKFRWWGVGVGRRLRGCIQ